MAMPKHFAISLDNIFDWCRKNNINVNDGCSRYFEHVGRLIELQIKSKTPIFTIYLLFDAVEKSADEYLAFSDHLAGFFSELCSSTALPENKVKISIFGKWYNLPGKAVESLKKIIEDTKEYDNFFLNFCINYDGQEEIVDVCKLIAKQVELGRIDPEMITKDTIKENLYASYFMPPDVILIYGEKKLTGLLLWDSMNSKIVFSHKSFMEFEEDDVQKLNHNLFK